MRCFRTSGLLARRGAAGVRLFTCNGYDWTDRFPAIVEAAARLKAQSFLIDGEAVIAPIQLAKNNSFLFMSSMRAQRGL